MSESIQPNKSSAAQIILLTIVLSVVYAIIRYLILGPIPWKDFPLFVLNKGLALAAFTLLVFNFSFGPLKNLGVKVP